MGARGPLKLAATNGVTVPAPTTGTAAADVQPVAPEKPAEVVKDAALSKAWDLIVPNLDRAGLLCPADLPAVVLCLTHYVVATRAYEALDMIVVEDEAHSGIKKNPAEAVLRAESEMFLKYAAQLGMTFVSRARTPSVKGGADGPANPFTPSG